MSQPFFTIGVPTYNRHGLLKQTLQSILSQEFTDFEVIVGNDYTDETLNGEMLGIADPRIHFVNHPLNLREVGNMNRLLELAEGRYFTWVFDDDLYEPEFLRTAYDTLAAYGYPSAFFSSFKTIQNGVPPQPAYGRCSAPEILTGREFLTRYNPIKPDLISTSGLFKTHELKAVVGGVEELCSSSIGLYCEYLLLVRCALLKSIVFTHIPLVTFRIHNESWGEFNTELPKYLEAGVNLVRKCADVLQHSSLKVDLLPNLMKICSIHLYSFDTKSAMFEVARNQFGIVAAKRAISMFFSESKRVRQVYCELIDCDPFRARRTFFMLELYCCRLMLFKLRHHRSLRAGK